MGASHLLNHLLIEVQVDLELEVRGQLLRDGLDVDALGDREGELDVRGDLLAQRGRQPVEARELGDLVHLLVVAQPRRVEVLDHLLPSRIARKEDTA